MAACTLIPRLPRTGTGTDICDKYGTRWKFDSNEDAWIPNGLLTSPLLVSEGTDGLITPEIFNQLIQLRNFATTVNQPILKILPGTDAYWYYFRSSDHFIKFRPEGEDALRLEVDKGRLFQVLMKEICPGPRGPVGPAGPQGQAGLPGPAELCYEPIINNNRLDFAIHTPTPLLGDRADLPLPNNHIPDISVRFFPLTLPQPTTLTPSSIIRKPAKRGPQTLEAHDQLQHLAIYYYGLEAEAARFQKTRDLLIKQSLGVATVPLCNIPLSRVLVTPTGTVIGSTPALTILIDPTGVLGPRVTFDPSIPVDVTQTVASIQFDSNTNLVCGSIYLLNGQAWTGDFCVKSRQQGPDGVSGVQGEAAVTIVQCQLAQTAVFATCPIITTRLDCAEQTVYTVCADIVNQICVDAVRLLAGSSTLSDRSGLDSVFAAAQMVLDDCKLIERHTVTLPVDTFTDLELAQWDPQPGCVSKRNFNRHKFDWVPGTDVPACAAVAAWYGPDGVRPGKYPWPITTEKAPAKDQCCVAAGSLIHTNTGLRPIEELTINDLVLCPDGEFRPIEQFYNNGIKDCIEIEFNDGNIIVLTPDHKIPVGGIIIEAKDLQPWDQVYKANGVLDWLITNKPGTDADFEFGYIIGYILGDGWISSKSVGILAYKTDLVALNRCYEFMAKRFGARAPHGPSSAGIYRYTWAAQSVLQHFIDLGYYKNLKERKVTIPNSIYQQSYAFYRGFFSAAITTDGSVGKEGTVNINHSIMEIVARTHKNLLDYLGISATLKHHRQSTNSFSEAPGDCWRVDVHHHIVDSKQFRDLIDDIIVYKKDKLRAPVDGLFVNKSAEQALPITIDNNEFSSGLVAGAFMFFGSYNKESKRAAVQKRMPSVLRQALVGLVPNIPTVGNKFYKNAYNIIGKHYDHPMTISWAAGFFSARLYGTIRTTKNREFHVCRNKYEEAELVRKAATTLGCKIVQDVVPMPFDNEQYRTKFSLSQSIYRLFCTTGHRGRLSEIKLRPPAVNNDVVGVRSIRRVDQHSVYDYAVAPHYLMLVGGRIMVDCQEDFFYCPNIQESGCAGGATVAPPPVTPPPPVPPPPVPPPPGPPPPVPPR